MAEKSKSVSKRKTGSWFRKDGLPEPDFIVSGPSIVKGGDKTALPGRKKEGKTAVSKRKESSGKKVSGKVLGKAGPELVFEGGVPVCYKNGKQVPVGLCFDVDVNKMTGNLALSMKKQCVISPVNKKKFREQMIKSKTNEWYGLLDKGAKWKE